MKNHSSGYIANLKGQGSAVAGVREQDMDVSLLQRPLQTAFSGFQEAKRAFEDGTSEVRRLLLQECSLIYECNVCRNMFRSFANFISHKRVFCVALSSFGFHNGSDSKSAMVVQTADGGVDHIMRSRSTGSSPTPTAGRQSTRNSLRDISRVIERLRREKAPIADSYGKNTTTLLQLESVPTSKHAVYQTVKQQETDSIKTEVDEVHQLLSKPLPTVIGPDGKVMTRNAFIKASTETLGARTELTSIKEETKTKNYVCEICKLVFQTEKTLKIHDQKKHSLSAYVFQCPACSLTFLQAAAVIRHLSKEHKKPTRRIRLMRESILKRCMQQGDVQAKGPSRELKRLQINETAGKEAVNTVGTGEKRKIMSSCIYCEKSFERRAALSTHLLNCRAKQEALQKPPPPVRRHNISESTAERTNANVNTSRKNDSAQIMGSNGHAVKQEPYAEERQSSDQRNQKVRIKRRIFDYQSSSGCNFRDDDIAEENDSINKIFADLADKQLFTTGLQTVSFDKLETQESDSASVEAVKLEDTEDVQPITNSNDEQNEIKTKEDKSKFKKSRNTPSEKLLKCRCRICNKQFNALSNVRRHISMFHYRARRFGCKLCEYRAFRRYDIVNHLGFVHKLNGDREQLSIDYVTAHDCKYTKEDIDGDIVLLNDDIVEADADATTNNTCNEDTSDAIKSVVKEPGTKVIRTYEKRLKRKKICNENTILKNSSDQTEESFATKIKLRRSRTDTESKSEKDAEKRPIRKRIKAENKDFVYDLSRLLKNDAEQPVLKRRNASEDGDIIEQRMQRAWTAYITDENKPLVQGSTRRIMLQLVSQGRAVSASLPELPAERPQMRPRLTSIVRGEPINQTSVIETVRVDNIALPKSTVFNHSFIERIAMRTATGTGGAVQHEQSAIDNLKRKVDAALLQTKIGADSDCADDTRLRYTADAFEGDEQEQKHPQLEIHKEVADVECKTSDGSNSNQAQAMELSDKSMTPPRPATLMPNPLENVNLVENSTLDSLLRTALQN